jgi:hypothetical protein
MEYIKVEVCYTFCEQTGNKIIDTDTMIHCWNEEMNTLINRN